MHYKLYSQSFYRALVKFEKQLQRRRIQKLKKSHENNPSS
jgi:hypothetical protein